MKCVDTYSENYILAVDSVKVPYTQSEGQISRENQSPTVPLLLPWRLFVVGGGRVVSQTTARPRRELKFWHVGHSHMKRYKFKVDTSAECVLYFSEEF